MNIAPPDPLYPIVENDGRMVETMRTFTLLTSLLPPLIGTGSPEGVVLAGQGRLYMDDAGTTGSILYIKRDAAIAKDGKRGWILV